MSKDASVEEALRLDRLQGSLPRTPKVVRILHEPYTDNLGARELLIRVVLENETRNEEMSAENLQIIREAIRAALRSDDRYPYIRFLTEQELDAPDEE